MYLRGSGATDCAGWRRPRARISDLALHSVPLTYGGTVRVWTRIRAGKPWAAGMSKDTRYRARGTLAAPTGMQPDGMAPVIPSAAFSGGFFMPKCPLAHSPWIVRILCTRAPGITSRATRRAQLHAPPAPSSRPPVPVVPAEGRRRHASRPPAHTRAGECRAAVCSEGRRAHRASSTCAGRSRRATARRSSPAAPPAPDGKPPGRRTPSAARPLAFPPDLDLRHQRRPKKI